MVPDHWPEISPADHPSSTQSFDVHYRPVVLAGRKGGYLLSGVVSTLRDIDPDVVITHGEPWYAFSLTVGMACSILSIPHLVFSWENLERVPISTLQRGLELVGFKLIDGFIAGSDAAARRLRNRGFSGSITEAPQTGVDTNSFTPDSGDESVLREFGVPTDVKVVLYAGRYSPEKGIESAIAAADDVLDKRDDSHFLFVGDGEFANEMERAVADREIEDEVTIVTERQPYSRMTSIFALADLFLYPSITTETWAEQFGYATAEAMSSGVPVITTECGALPDVVGEAGIVCPEDNPKALAEAIDELLSDDECRHALSKRARKRAVELFSLESVADAHLSFARRFA